MLGNRPTFTYLGIMNGKIIKRVPEGTPGATQRTNKAGASVHEVRYDHVIGILQEIGVSEGGPYGPQWLFTLQDGAESYRLQVGENTRELTSLLLALPGCDFRNPISISPYDFTDSDGKKRSGVTLKQAGRKVPWFFTRENPNGLPELKPVTIDGKETWDSSERIKFLRQYVDEHIAPLLPAPAASLPAEADDSLLPPDVPQDENRPEANDDLPF
ncbi:MAG: hypothetical protein LBL94_08535 [Prevotellaceae bacterium]|jgi:hypothetical protein|nr:hypothetical protein [Prevotellaceae bacterium]